MGERGSRPFFRGNHHDKKEYRETPARRKENRHLNTSVPSHPPDRFRNSRDGMLDIPCFQEYKNLDIVPREIKGTARK